MSILDSWARHATASELMDLKGVGSHQLKGHDFAQNFPGAVPGGVYTPTSFLGPMLSKGYQYGQELGKSILDGPGGYTMGQAWDEAGRQSDENIEGMKGRGVDKNMYNNFISTYGLDNVRSNIGAAEASIPTQDDMIQAGIKRQMIKEGTLSPQSMRQYGDMSMGYGRPQYVADRSPVSQALKATEIPELKVAGVPNYSEFDDFESYLQGDPKTYKQGIFSQIKNAANKYGAPIKQGIGTLMSMASGIPGLGLLMNSFTPNPSDPMSKSFAVGNPNAVFGQDYAGGRLPGQDAFGINTVSMFGNYPGYYDQYVQDYDAGKYSLNSKFAFDKYLHAKNVGNKNLNRIQKDYGSTNKTFNWQDHEQDKGGDVPSGNNYTGGAAQGTGGSWNPGGTTSSSGGVKTGAGNNPWGRKDGGRIGYNTGGLASLWRR
tara:strand:- start:1933 stop:3222 length:1290 start_codon:yes stop_codon:yes gene_type:complete